MGQGHRSKVKVTRSKNVRWEASLTSESLVYGPAPMDLPKKKFRHTAWGVFIAYAFFFTDLLGRKLYEGL